MEMADGISDEIWRKKLKQNSFYSFVILFITLFV
jgi:hypothetical protein